ncbi:MAG TPA: hypothetical protein PLV50_02990 [Smithella sp.]|nr:hypothetical protein [Smithella sp.]MDM7988723.1 hypothetical protein [Smithella sp.]HNY49332.1 hypothetical protein [Smithella sp.]HOG89477.1 hypothetical protein [Smithella sp.]HOU50160.1 hypothetical protein [Smithella sp.]
MRTLSKIKFSARVVLLTVAFVFFMTIPYAVGKLVIDPIKDTPLYPGGPAFPLGSLPVVHVTVPNAFTSGTTISSSQMNDNFKAVGNQMPGVEWANISKTGIDVSTNDVTLATVTVAAPTAGYVVVRFDGRAIADTGDRLLLAASDTETYNFSVDKCVVFEGDGNNHPFSHTRVYEVTQGAHSFYAGAKNSVNIAGDGKASIYGTLTATFYPNKY